MARDDRRQLEDFGVRKVVPQACESGVVDREMVEREFFTVVDRGSFWLRVLVASSRNLDVLIKGLGDAVPRLRRGAPIQSYRTVVDTCDSVANRFPYAERERRRLIDGGGQLVGGSTDLGSQLPETSAL